MLQLPRLPNHHLILIILHRNTPHPQRLPAAEHRPVLRPRVDHRLAGEREGVDQLGHALRLDEAAGEVLVLGDLDGDVHALHEVFALQDVAGVIERVVVLEEEFGDVGFADLLLFRLFGFWVGLG